MQGNNFLIATHAAPVLKLSSDCLINVQWLCRIIFLTITVAAAASFEQTLAAAAQLQSRDREKLLLPPSGLAFPLVCSLWAGRALPRPSPLFRPYAAPNHHSEALKHHPHAARLVGSR